MTDISNILQGYQGYQGASVQPNSAMGGVVLAQMRTAMYLSQACPQYAPQFAQWMGFPNASPYGPNYLPLPAGGYNQGYYDYEPPVMDIGNAPFAASAGAGALIYVASTTTPTVEQVQQDSQGNPMYDMVYAMSVTCWVRTRYVANTVDINAPKTAWALASKARSYLQTLIRCALFLQRDLGTLGICLIDVSTLSEQRAMPMISKANTFIAGGEVMFRMRQRETLTIAPLGIVADPINVDTALLPVDPNLFIPPYQPAI